MNATLPERVHSHRSRALLPTLAVLTTVLFTKPARAQVTITFTATANATQAGYNSGQAYTFSFSVPSNYPNNPSSVFNLNGFSEWQEDNLSTDSQLFNAVTGSGLNGTFTRPTNTNADPLSFVEVATPGSTGLTVVVSADISTSVGFTTLNATPFLSVTATATGLPSFAGPGTYTAPGTYFTPYIGNYPSATGNLILATSTYTHVEDFTITGVSIGVSAIPEPATYAAILGLGVLGFAVYRKRRYHVAHAPNTN